MMKKATCLMLALMLLVSLLPMTAAADHMEIGPAPLNGAEYQNMTTSQKMVDMIKDFEGFSPEPYWDVSQWSIGYGSACGYDKDNKPDITMTEPEAAAKLVELLESEKYGGTVNDLFREIKRQPSQQQFDALVSFTYNLGGGWTNGCRLVDWLVEPTDDLALADAMGAWSRVGEKISYQHVIRRLREANVFLWGEYGLPYGNAESDLPVLPQSEIGHYKMVIFQSEGGKFEAKSDLIRIYRADQPYGSFPTPTWEDHTFMGYDLIEVNDKAVEFPSSINADAVASNHVRLQAVWATNVPPETDPTESQPTDPTESQPSDPTESQPTDPTESQPTDPTESQPTDPTESQPTDPTESQPSDPTESQPTDPTESQPTEPSEPETEPTEPETEPTEPELPVELPFRDVRTKDWFHDPVAFVYSNGYMSGTSDTTFGPKTSMNRGMLVQVLYRIAESPEVTDEQRNVFVDARDTYYTDGIAWAKANGIVSGVSETRFGTNQKITRQDAITIFYQYCVSYLGMDGTNEEDLSDFADTGRLSGYAVEPMKWAVSRGLVSGASGNGGLKLNPTGTLSRAEGATMLMALVTKVLQ